MDRILDAGYQMPDNFLSGIRYLASFSKWPLHNYYKIFFFLNKNDKFV